LNADQAVEIIAAVHRIKFLQVRYASRGGGERSFGFNNFANESCAARPTVTAS
jgi:hypothetical protein